MYLIPIHHWIQNNSDSAFLLIGFFYIKKQKEKCLLHKFNKYFQLNQISIRMMFYLYLYLSLDFSWFVVNSIVSTWLGLQVVNNEWADNWKWSIKLIYHQNNVMPYSFSLLIHWAQNVFIFFVYYTYLPM